MKYLIIGIIAISILLVGLVNAVYVAPGYTNVTIVLDSTYSTPTYTNVTVVLDESTGETNCWTETSNIIYIPSGCVYTKLNGQVS